MENKYRQFSPDFDKPVKLKIDAFKEQLITDLEKITVKLNTTNLNMVFVNTEKRKLKVLQKVALSDYADLYGTKFELLDEFDKLLENESLSEVERDRMFDSIDVEIYKGRLPEKERIYIDSLALVNFSLDDSILFLSGSKPYLNLIDISLRDFINLEREADTVVKKIYLFQINIILKMLF